MYKLSFPKINKDGYVFIAAFAAVTLVFYLLSDFLGLVGLVLTAWCVYFFRDPDRVVPKGDNLILSPADGVVHQVVPGQSLPAELTETTDESTPESAGWTRISIFLNIFNVHVNRIPLAGQIIKSVYRPGKFLNAALDKASKDNERQSLIIETRAGKNVAFCQIAGLIARRIRCDVRLGDQVIAGQRFGLIRFGSRCDVFVPDSVKVSVIKGQKMIAGESILASLDVKRDGDIPTGDIR